MVALVLLALVLQEPVGMLGGGPLGQLVPVTRRYPRVPLAALATTRITHVEVCGPVVYVRKQRRDGDVHVTISDGKTKVVAEIIPSIPLPRPVKGQIILVHGISRYDRFHKWGEVHPVEWWERVTTC